MSAALEALVGATLDTPAPAAARAMLGEVLRRGGDSVAAVLFYGSCRRSEGAEEGVPSGLLDLYVLYDRPFHRSRVAAALTAVLPPHVVFLSTGDGGPAAKVACMSCRQFVRRTRPGSLDTTVWARFSQPATLLHARDPAARRQVVSAVAQAVRTAATWALRLSPNGADPARCWQALFAHTYGAELRPERRNRPALVYQADPGWFDNVLALVRAEQAIPAPVGRWLPRRILGKPLNLLRLVKAAFTVEAGTAYVLSKLERHAAVRVVPSAWQCRHPLLAAPVLLWRIRFGRR